MNPATLTLLPRLRPLPLPPCSDATAYVLLLTSHANSSRTSTEITRHGSVKGRLEGQFRLLQACIESLRLAESRCRRDVVLLVDRKVESRLSSCRVMGCRATRIFADWAARAGVARIVVPHVVDGVPAADKINAFALTQYRALVWLDADMLVLQDLDGLFENHKSLTIAHHPYDLAQGKQCGIPLAMRGVSGLVALRPNTTVYAELVNTLHAANSSDLEHYSEQLTLACYFHLRRRMRTLACSYVYDVATPRYMKGEEHGGFRNCVRFGGASRAACEEIAQHVQDECLWANTHMHAHAVHYKGNHKPWESSTDSACADKGMGQRLLLTAARNRSFVATRSPLLDLAPANATVDASAKMLTGTQGPTVSNGATRPTSASAQDEHCASPGRAVCPCPAPAATSTSCSRWSGECCAPSSADGSVYGRTAAKSWRMLIVVLTSPSVVGRGAGGAAAAASLGLTSLEPSPAAAPLVRCRRRYVNVRRMPCTLSTCVEVRRRIWRRRSGR
jgi:hypothetical protein